MKKSCSNCKLCRSSSEDVSFCGLNWQCVFNSYGTICDDYECMYDDEYLNDIVEECIYNDLAYEGL